MTFDPVTTIQEQRRRMYGAALRLTYARIAKDNFLSRVDASPKASLDRFGSHVAHCLARHAELTDDCKLDVEISASDMAQALKLSYPTTRDRLMVLQTLELIEIRRWGAGNGRPTQVRLLFSSDDYKKISDRTERKLEKEIAAKVEINSMFRSFA